MGYRWPGMRVLDSEEVDILYQNGRLDGCYKLFPEGTTSEVNGMNLQEIADHYNNGGEFGEELPTVELELMDGKKITAPKVVELIGTSALEELEYSLWSILEEYFTFFGIRTEDDSPDWATVKAVQSKILDVLTRAGVEFQYLTCRNGVRGYLDKKNVSLNTKKEDDKEVAKAELQIVLTQENIDDIMCGALEGGITYWCCKAEVVGEYLGQYSSEQISRGGQLRLHDRETKKVYTLTKQKLLNGVEKWVRKPVGYNCMEYRDGKLQIDCCNADMVVCDAMIQYAVFGDVIYG